MSPKIVPSNLPSVRGVPRAQGMWLLRLLLCAAGVAGADSLEAFRARQEKVIRLLEQAVPTTVAITSREPGGTGSGVVVSKDGLILTAAHVTEATGKELTIVFPDGRRVVGTALGANRTLDAGLAKITEPGPWPYSTMGNSDILAMGTWCVALGHPGGFMPDRPPPARIGLIWHRDQYGAIYSDCTLIGGDSGGPLFNLDGQVIGIHSSIGGSLSTNRHVSTDSFRLHWDRMLLGQTWGKLHLDPDRGDLATMGVELDWSSKDGARVRAVRTNAPAAAAGVQSGDVIVKFDGNAIASSIQLLRKLAELESGYRAGMSVQRGGEIIDMEVTLTNYKSLTSPPHEDDNAVADAPYLGVELGNPEQGSGAQVTKVMPGSPAEHAGIRVDDIITAMDGDAIASDDALIEQILQRAPEGTVTLTVRRPEGQHSITLKLGRQ